MRALSPIALMACLRAWPSRPCSAATKSPIVSGNAIGMIFQRVQKRCRRRRRRRAADLRRQRLGRRREVLMVFLIQQRAENRCTFLVVRIERPLAFSEHDDLANRPRRRVRRRQGAPAWVDDRRRLRFSRRQARTPM